MEIRYEIKVVGGKKLKHHKLWFLSRIDNDGKSLIEIKQQPDYFINDKFKIFCLSITNKTWVATNGMSTYIVELIDVKAHKKLPNF